MEQTGLLFPKTGKKRKRKIKHTQSIMHNKSSRTCFLCAMLDNNWQEYTYLEEHHVFPGNANRQLSEEYGLKVYLCPAHHRTGKNAVHQNNETMKRLQKLGQQIFEREYPDKNFCEIFGKNYL